MIGISFASFFRQTVEFGQVLQRMDDRRQTVRKHCLSCERQEISHHKNARLDPGLPQNTLSTLFITSAPLSYRSSVRFINAICRCGTTAASEEMPAFAGATSVSRFFGKSTITPRLNASISAG